MTPDGELLRQYAVEGSEAAFAELVRRHVDLVYSVALRQAAGDSALAQDATQLVFIDLARKARVLSGRATLSGWLHTSARFAASKAIRGEQRRRAREQESLTMNENPAAEINWEQLRPLLDESVGQLKEADRDAIVLRFFQGKNHQEIGAILGLSENSANKRIERALEKLREYFASRGVKASSALLAAAISANSVQAAPAGLAEKITPVSLAGIGGASLGSGLFLALLMNTKIKVILGAAIVLALALMIKLSWHLPANTAISDPPPVAAASSAKVEAPAAQAVKIAAAPTADGQPATARPADAPGATPAEIAATEDTPPPPNVNPQADVQTLLPALIKVLQAGDYVGLVNYIVSPDELKQMIASGQIASKEELAQQLHDAADQSGGAAFAVQGLQVVMASLANPSIPVPGATPYTVNATEDRIAYSFQTQLGPRDIVFSKKNGLWYAFQKN